MPRLRPALLFLALSSCRPAPHAVPASQEPRHHLVYSSDLANVMDVRVGAGDTTLWHIHAHPLVVVQLRDARSWEQSLGSAPSPVESAGSMPAAIDNWSRAQPYTHRVANVDTIGFHYVAAEWLKSSGLACDSLPESPTRHLVKAGPTALVYELTIAAHDSIPNHSHSCPGLIVQGTAGALTNDGPRATATGGTGEGQWSWHAPAYTHTLRNAGTTPLLVFEIDWR